VPAKAPSDLPRTPRRIPVLRTSDRGESRLVFPFANGSLYDETAVFSQRDIFRLLTDRIAQRCPSQNA